MAWLVVTVSELGCFLSVGQCPEVVPGVKPFCERDELLTVDGLMAADQRGGDLQIRWLMLFVSDWTFCRIPVA